MLKSIIAAAVLSAAIAPSFAGERTPRIHQRQVHQQERIGAGVANGSLTPRETMHLEAREQRIQRNKVAAKSDGTVTPAERARLRGEERRTSRAIYRQKHD